MGNVGHVFILESIDLWSVKLGWIHFNLVSVMYRTQIWVKTRIRIIRNFF